MHTIYHALNEKAQSRYVSLYERVQEIKREAEGGEDQLQRYADQVAGRLMTIVELEKQVSGTYFDSRSIEELLKENHDMHKMMDRTYYERAYANPTYAVQQLGEEAGHLLCAVAEQVEALIQPAFSHEIFKIANVMDVFCAVYTAMKDQGIEKAQTVYKELKTSELSTRAITRIHDNYNSENDRLTKLTCESDLSDLSYLFQYGVYVTENEVKTAEFLNAYDEAKLEKVTEAIVLAYIEGFKRDNKDITLRSDVRIIGNVGQERITRSVIQHFAKHNLKGYVAELQTTNPNKQFEYDHKFDSALVLDKAYADLHIEKTKEAYNELQDVVKRYSGVLWVERFGEEPFTPASKKERLVLSQDQQGEFQRLQSKSRQTMEQFIPEQERSFCIVAFPTPEIGTQFEDIFEDIIRVNMLDSVAYEKVQQKVIDALDEGKAVHVKGQNGNETDIFVQLPKLSNPAKETNFVNCVADVNIPVGEVFTSPQLKGTNGLLHLKEVYLDGFKYHDLKLTFKDGYVAEYTCANFEDEEANKKFIQENLLFPHKTLPLGEFAIGTNTLAYVISEKYGIIDQLPILIVEKMGPHFAIGDTCFSWSEDNPVYNPMDGKEIVARDNEHSIVRKESLDKAYTNCHTDITLPYDGLEKISVLKDNGVETDIIRNGRFVLEGTELLNEPFEK